MNITDDEALGFMDRLLEWLRQADLTSPRCPARGSYRNASLRGYPP